jgi:NADH-quinone oxidoreductase subunit L
MENLLPLFLLIPFVGFVVSLIIPSKNEKGIFLSMAIPVAIQVIVATGFTIYWAMFDQSTLNIKEITLYDNEHYSFFIDLLFDKVTATYLIMSSTLTFMIAMFS